MQAEPNTTNHYLSSCNQPSIVLCTSFMRSVNMETCAILKFLHRIITQGSHHERSRLQQSLFRSKNRGQESREECKPQAASRECVSRSKRPVHYSGPTILTLASSPGLRSYFADLRARERLLSVCESCSSFSISLLHFDNIKLLELPRSPKHLSQAPKDSSWKWAE